MPLARPCVLVQQALRLVDPVAKFSLLQQMRLHTYSVPDLLHDGEFQHECSLILLSSPTTYNMYNVQLAVQKKIVRRREMIKNVGYPTISSKRQ